jgi:histidine triad (HIT) family protein
MENSGCIFCKIVEGIIPSKKVFENENVIAFNDLHPLAAKHFLFVHKTHSKDIEDMMTSGPNDIKDIYQAITEFGKKEGLNATGYRIVTNMGAHAGQTVFHTHFHVLGGEQLKGFGK